jgi:hypothetical protein
MIDWRGLVGLAGREGLADRGWRAAGGGGDLSFA